MKVINIITLLLIIVGGINWGLAAFDFNLVETLFGPDFANVIYALVGLSALWQIIPWMQALRTDERLAEAGAARRGV